MKNFLNSHSRGQKMFIAWYKLSRFKKIVNGDETPHRGSVCFLMFKVKGSLFSLFSRMRSFLPSPTAVLNPLIWQPLQIWQPLGENKYGCLRPPDSPSNKSFRNVFLFYQQRVWWKERRLGLDTAPFRSPLCYPPTTELWELSETQHSCKMGMMSLPVSGVASGVIHAAWCVVQEVFQKLLAPFPGRQCKSTNAMYITMAKIMVT